MLKLNFAPAKISLPRNSWFVGFVFGRLSPTAELKGCGDDTSCGLGAAPGGSLLTVAVVDVLDEEGSGQHHGHHGTWRGVAHGALCCRGRREKGCGGAPGGAGGGLASPTLCCGIHQPESAQEFSF